MHYGTKDWNDSSTSWSGLLELEYIRFLSKYGSVPDAILVGSKTYSNFIVEINRERTIQLDGGVVEDLLYWRGLKIRKANFFSIGIMFLLAGTGIKGEESPGKNQDWTIEERNKK